MYSLVGFEAARCQVVHDVWCWKCSHSGHIKNLSLDKVPFPELLVPLTIKTVLKIKQIDSRLVEEDRPFASCESRCSASQIRISSRPP